MSNLGSGCINCVAESKCSAQLYRGACCRKTRSEYGLGDPVTVADRIRSMSDENLAECMFRVIDCEGEFRYCKNLPECITALDNGSEIPDEKCIACLLSWLREGAENR